MDDIKQAVVEALEEEGYESQIEEDGDISFEVDEDTYYVCFASDDDEQDYFRVIWLSDSYDADRRVELLEQLNELTSSYRVAKTYLTDSDDGTIFVTCAVETYADVESFVQYLGDYIGILQEAVSELPECESRRLPRARGKRLSGRPGHGCLGKQYSCFFFFFS